NITMFDPKLNKLAEKAVQWVDLNKDIQKFPAGIKTAVDLDQDNLSGGQKQKIILARALVHQTKWLFIDEGTSA
ncbi:ATP-binding cassette domain-containing protein, partial [Lactobacillus helveticus]